MKQTTLKSILNIFLALFLALSFLACTPESPAPDTNDGAQAEAYTVTFVDHDGKTLYTATVEQGQGATAPSAPTREGYTFVGWDRAFDNVTANITVKAVYEPITVACDHTDTDNDGTCDSCQISVVVIFDIYALNDLHGKLDDGDSCVGVDELSTYLSNAFLENSATILLSSGDMWQGSAESNLTKGLIITDWMNEMGFASMTLGNHEFDWGSEYISDNADLADFSILAINIYDRTTGKRADFCESSVIVEKNGVKVGIIGAIGDCRSSISSSHVTNYDFKVGRDLTALVKAESERLRALGCELIIYSLHDGYGSSASGVGYPSASAMSSYYDVALSDGYVDLVFEGHSHQSYVHVDTHGVYHLQNGEYDNGISHVEISVNIANDAVSVASAEIVENDEYDHLDDHPVVDDLLDKYEDMIAAASREVGYNAEYRDSTFIRQLVANLYLERGLEKWGEKYDIVLGGGYISTRDPYMLPAGMLQYHNLVSVLPFDNAIYLCSISGAKLKSQFIYTTNKNYFIAYSDYGSSVADEIQDNETYYIITDKYSVDYRPNALTAIECLGENIFARDLVADYVLEGNLDTEVETLTIAEALALGAPMSHGQFTTDKYYVEGEIVEIVQPQYGNCYLRDGEGNQIYVYGLYDGSGNRYDAMANPPKVGDKIRVLSVVGKHNQIIELKNATVLAILAP